MACPRGAHQVSVERPELSVGRPWDIRGVSVGCPSVVRGVPLGYPWNIRDISLGHL